MALTRELLIAESALTGLTDEQITAITTLSNTDENRVIGTRIAELHTAYEQDILNLTGITKNQNEKAYDYNKRVLATYKNNVTKTLADIEALKAEKLSLEQKIQEGITDKTIKDSLTLVQQQLKDAQKEVETKTEHISKLEKQHAEDLHKAKVDFQFAMINKDIKLKPEYTPVIASTLLQQAKTELMHKYAPDFVVDASGNETLVFRDKETKDIVRNPANGLQPYAISELYETTIIKDAIDKGRKQQGGGTKEPGGSNGGQTFDLAGAKTQLEADNLIYTHLMSKGLTRGSSEFAQEQMKIRQENNVEKLPLR